MRLYESELLGYFQFFFVFTQCDFKRYEQKVIADVIFIVEPGPEQLQKSLTNVQSPEKGVPTTTGTEQISSREQLKHESTQPSSKTQDSHPHNKTSAGRKDPPAPKEGTSVAPGSRNKRRGTIENAEPDGKVGNSSTTKSKEKGAREKEKSKSGGKSAKKVNIEENKEKHIYSNTSGECRLPNFCISSNKMKL